MDLDLVYQADAELLMQQKAKKNTAYRSWEESIFGVPDSSILGPLLFNIFICDLFLTMDKRDFASYAGDNTSYVMGNDVKEAIYSLKEASENYFTGLQIIK